MISKKVRKELLAHYKRWLSSLGREPSPEEVVTWWVWFMDNYGDLIHFR